MQNRRRAGVALRRRAFAVLAMSVVGLSVAVLVPPAGAADQPWVRVTFLNVNKGDSALYEAWCGEAGVVDIAKGAANKVLDALDRRGSRALKWVVASHYHGDHIGDIHVLGRTGGVKIESVYDRGGGPNDGDTSSYSHYYKWVNSSATVRRPVDIGSSFELCASTSAPVRFDVLSSATDGTAAGGVPVYTENDRSICLKMTLGDFKLASCGDLGGTDTGSVRDVETAVAADYGRVDFVKANHHGHAVSSNPTFVSTLAPAATVLSTTTADPGVVSRWGAVGEVLQTADASGAPLDGDVVVSSTGSDTFSVAAASSGRAFTLPINGTSATTSPSTTTTTAPTTTTTTAPTTTTSTSTTTAPTTTTTSTTTTTTTTTVPAGGTYSSAVAADQPVAYWRLGERSGTTAADASGKGATGTYSGAVTLGAQGVLYCDLDTAVGFDGGTARMKVPDRESLRMNGAFTLELWAKSTRFANTYPGLITKGASWTPDGYILWNSSDGALHYKRNGDDRVGTSPGALVTDRFRHFVLTYDGTVARWYVDGVLDRSTTVTYPTNAGTSTFALGMGDQAGAQVMDEVALFDRALSATRVSAHYAAGRRTC